MKTNYELHAKAIKEYQDKKARITLWVEPELKAQLRAAADREGVSLTRLN